MMASMLCFVFVTVLLDSIQDYIGFLKLFYNFLHYFSSFGTEVALLGKLGFIRTHKNT